VRSAQNPRNDIRAGEVAVRLPPANDAGLIFIGRINTPWAHTARLPAARSFGRSDLHHHSLCSLAGGTRGDQAFERLEVLYWLHQSGGIWFGKASS
jgi:hypothetical protein